MVAMLLYNLYAHMLQVDYVRVYKRVGGYERTQVPRGCPLPPVPDNCPPEVMP